jgi:hypothetical protein
MIGALRSPNPVICGSGEPVMTYARHPGRVARRGRGRMAFERTRTALHWSRLLLWHLPLLRFHTMVAQNGSGARP